MTDPGPSVQIQDLIDRAEVTDVLARYAHGVDRRDWALVRSCYHRDAHDDHGLYQGDVDGLITFLTTLAEQFLTTTHHLGNPVIVLDGGSARVETPCLGWYRRPGHDGTVRSIVQGVRYLDRLEWRDQRWAIADRTVVLDWEHVFDPNLPSPEVPGWSRGRPGPDDPSVAHLGSVLPTMSATTRTTASTGIAP